MRVRPLLPHEADEPVGVAVQAGGGSLEVALPCREAGKAALAINQRVDARSYSLDACLDGSVSQQELFETCGLEQLAHSAVDGFNVTVFAFGQTGSGKTHTLFGSNAEATALIDMQQSMCQQQEHSRAELGGLGLSAPGDTGTTVSGNGGSASCSGIASTTASSSGINHGCNAGHGSSPPLDGDGLLPRCLAALFAAVSARQDDVHCHVTVSCCELYNETVTDMLRSNRASRQQPLQVRALLAAMCMRAHSAARQVLSIQTPPPPRAPCPQS